MKQLFSIIIAALLLFSLAGCASGQSGAQIAATTLPVYEFTSILCRGTNLSVTQLVTESVSCLHDYSLSVRQVKAVEAAELVVLSGGGLEDFMAELLENKTVIDSSENIPLLESCHAHDHGHGEEHHHEADPHIWLSPKNAMDMAANICEGLSAAYPEYTDHFEQNLAELLAELQQLQTCGENSLAELSCRELITFHDGFAYLAQAFDLEILAAVEEESGSEASASELKELITLTRGHSLPAIFTETNGSASAADVIAAESGVSIFTLDMAMSGSSYFAAMYRNIDALKEALG